MESPIKISGFIFMDVSIPKHFSFKMGSMTDRLPEAVLLWRTAWNILLDQTLHASDRLNVTPVATSDFRH
jgi:hypothetical protein